MTHENRHLTSCHLSIVFVLMVVLNNITELVIGFEKTFLNVSENVGNVEICVNITQPSSAPIEIKPFNLTVKTRAGTAGQLAILMIADSMVLVFSYNNISCSLQICKIFSL